MRDKASEAAAKVTEDTDKAYEDLENAISRASELASSGMSEDEVWQEIYNETNDEDLANDALSAVDGSIFNENQNLDEGIEVDSNGNTNYIFTDEDINYVKNLFENNPLIYVNTSDSGTSLDIGLNKTDFIDGGIINITDKFCEVLEEHYKEFGELHCNNTGSTFWIRVPFETSMKNFEKHKFNLGKYE